MYDDWNTHNSNGRTRHDPLGALKTAGLVVVLFGAMLVSAMSVARAQTSAGADASCAPGCRTQHNACRLQSKGAPRCDGELQACVNRCIALRQAREAKDKSASSPAPPSPAMPSPAMPASARSLATAPKH